MYPINHEDSAWIQSLLKNQKPDGASLREHLLLVHKMNPGFTESCAQKCVDDYDRNTYEILANVVDPSTHLSVLEIACGSGVLLQICDQRCGENIELSGIDMSSEELVLARSRNPSPKIKLYQGVSQDMNFLRDGSFDVVLCHWALTLMDEVSFVLREIKRVLKPGGIFAAIVDGEPSTAPGYEEVHNLIYNQTNKEIKNYGAIDLGDPRVRNTQALEVLVGATFEDVNIQVEPLVFNLKANPDVLAREVAGFFYASFLLSSLAYQQLLEKLAAQFDRQNAGDQSKFALPVNKLIVTR